MSPGDRADLERRTFIRGIGAVGATAALGEVATARPGRDPGSKTRELLVGVARRVDDVEAAVAKHLPGSASVVHSNDRIGYAAVEFRGEAPEHAREKMLKSGRRDREIRYAEANATYEALYEPTDPLYGEQYAPETVGCEEAWETTLGDSDVTIAVVDQGVQYDHPDLAANAEGGADFVDDDGDPYPEAESENHGTHVAGIAGGDTDNGVGHAGISDCSLLSARALDESGSGSLSDIADAITWAADRGADVINLSLGGAASSTLRNAVSYADDRGALLVAAAGNDGQPDVSYPAAYRECLAVSALDPDGTLADYSNYGEEIELAAPGTNVLSAVNWDEYARFSGTSMASPVVAGTAGLALSNWNLSNDDLRLHLKATADDVGLSPAEQGEGRVDADDAVHADPEGSEDGAGATCGSRSTSTEVSDSLSSSWDADCWYYEWEYDAPCQVVVELSGPDDAAFDLYVAEDEEACPTTDDYDYASASWGSDERIVVDYPDASTPLHALVDSYAGGGEYELTITEKGE